MRDNTKSRLIEIGAGIIHLKGFNHTGIQEILKVAEVPKGSFYNYFKNKEDFGLQVIDYFVDYMAQVAGGVLADHSVSPLERIRKIAHRVYRDLQGEGLRLRLSDRQPVTGNG